MNMEDYKVDTKGFKARVNCKTKNGIVCGVISNFYLINEALYGVVEYNNRSITPVINIKKSIKNRVIKIRNYTGDITSYIKSLAKSNKKACVEQPANHETGEIVNFLKENNVEHFVHFTPVKNLKSILEHGICSNNYCNEHGIAFMATDEDRLDGYTDFISLSISFPNYKMFYKKRQIMGENFVVLLIDSSVMNLYDSTERKFSSTNAASNNRKIGGEIDDLQRMFGNVKLREELSLQKNYTTDPQAEILLKGRIPAEYIREIHFNTPLDYVDAKEYADNKLLKLNALLFAGRKDYEFWSNKEGYHGETTCIFC